MVTSYYSRLKFISYLINSFTPNSSQEKMELPLNYFK